MAWMVERPNLRPCRTCPPPRRSRCPSSSSTASDTFGRSGSRARSRLDRARPGGYDERFAEIAKKLGPVDWAIMDDGQYDKAWQSVHLLPEEVRQATLDLKARHLLP